jgi:hypothetical protein
MPESASVPSLVATAIEVVVNQGPPTTAALWPVGRPTSRTTVKPAELVPPAFEVAVTVWAPSAVAVDVQE